MRRRVLATIVGMYVVGAASVAWRLWRNGLLGVLLYTGASGYVLLGYWFIALTIGLFGCVQLWRGHQSGRVASVFFVGCGIACDVGLYLLADAGGAGQLPSAGVRGALLVALVFALPGSGQGVAKAAAA